MDDFGHLGWEGSEHRLTSTPWESSSRAMLVSLPQVLQASVRE